MAKIEDFAADDPRSITDGPFGSNLKTAHYTEQGPRVIRLQNIGDGRFIDERAHISEEHYDKLKAHSVEAGDVVIASLGNDLPRACTVPSWLGPAIVKADCIRLRPAEAVDGRYVVYMLNAPQSRQAVKDLIHGVGRPRLGLRVIREIEIPRAPLDEQQRIVQAIEEQFSRLDAGVGWSRRASLSLDRMRASILKAAVEGRLRGSQTADSLPDGWVMASPDALAAPERNALAIGPFGSNLKVSDYATTGVPLVFVRSIRRRRFDGGDTKFVTPEKAAELHSHQVEPGDLLITKMGDPPGDAAVYSGSGPAIITADCIKLRPHPDVDVRYLDIAFNSPVARSQILAITRGVAQKKISLGRFRNEVKIPLPPPGEQRAIVTEVERSLSLVEALEGTVALGLAKAESLRRSILGEAFAGRLTRAASQRELGSA